MQPKKRLNWAHKVVNIISIMIIIAGFFSIGIYGIARFYKYNRPPCPKTCNGRALVISIRASGGHMSTAKAIQGKLAEDGYSADIFYIDDYDPMQIGKFYDSALTTSVGRVFINLIGAKVYWSSARAYISNLSELLPIWLSEGQYHCIISVMPFTYKLVRISLGLLGVEIPFIIIPTDLEDPQVGCGYWIDGPNAKYLLGSGRLFDQASSLSNKKRISGLITKQEFIEDIKSKYERRLELNLPLDKNIILILFGSCGSREMNLIAQVLSKEKKNHYIFVCGKDQLLFKSLQSMTVKHKSNYTIYGFTTNIHKLMQASDIFIGKPGAVCISECIESRLPMIFRKSSDILLQERYNMEYVIENGICKCISKWQDLPVAIDSILKNRIKYANSFEKLRKNNSLFEVSDIIKSTIDEYKIIKSCNCIT